MAFWESIPNPTTGELFTKNEWQQSRLDGFMQYCRARRFNIPNFIRVSQEAGDVRLWLDITAISRRELGERMAIADRLNAALSHWNGWIATKAGYRNLSKFEIAVRTWLYHHKNRRGITPQILRWYQSGQFRRDIKCALKINSPRDIDCRLVMAWLDKRPYLTHHAGRCVLPHDIADRIWPQSAK